MRDGKGDVGTRQDAKEVRGNVRQQMGGNVQQRFCLLGMEKLGWMILVVAMMA